MHEDMNASHGCCVEWRRRARGVNTAGSHTLNTKGHLGSALLTDRMHKGRLTYIFLHIN